MDKNKDMNKNKGRPVFDMNQCKVGDLLESIHGAKLEYLGKNDSNYDFPHRVRYLHIPGENVNLGNEGSRSNEGWTYTIKPLPMDHDIKGFWEGKEPTTMKDATGKTFVGGQKYGYYRNEKGYTKVIIGEGHRSNAAGKVKLCNCEEKTYLYNDGVSDPISIEHGEKPRIVFCNILFPVT